MTPQGNKMQAAFFLRLVLGDLKRHLVDEIVNKITKSSALPIVECVDAFVEQ